MRRQSGLALLACLIAPIQGVAQARDSTRADSVRFLEDLVVTARRPVTSIYQLPLAVTRIEIPPAMRAGGYSVTEALSRVPGVLVQSRYGTSDVRLVIRGFGARGAGDRSNAGTSRGVRVLLDGFPETEPDGRTSFDGIDLAAAHSVEVIRSNASSLWGNAAGGVVSFTTVPHFEDGYADLETAFGSFGLQRYIGHGGATLGNGRLAGTVTHTVFDGWRRHSAAERTLLNAGIVSELGTRSRLGVYLMGSSNRFLIPGPLTQAEVEADPQQANATYASRNERRFNRIARIGMNFEQGFGSAGALSTQIFVNPKILQRSERGTFRDFTRYHLGGNLVYRVTGSVGQDRKAGLLAGVDEAYQDGAILFYSLTPEGNRGTELRDNMGEGANNLGVFLEGNVDLTEQWAVTLGGRYDAIKYHSRSYLNPRLDARKTFDRLTPKLGVNFRLTPTQSFYLNVGGGVEAPAGNETDPASTFGQDTVTALNPLLAPIRSTTYEIGTKQVALLGGWLEQVSYDVSLYRTNVTNEIVPYRGGRFYFTAGKVRRYGAELGLVMRSRSGISLESAVTWSNHKYIDYRVDSVHYGRPNQFADYSGNRIVGVPDWIYHVTLGIAPKALDVLELRLGIQGESRYFADDANRTEVPSYTLANLGLGLRRPIDLGPAVSVRGSISINNLFDRRYIASAFLNPDVVNGVPVAFEPGLARSVTVSVSVGRR